MKQSSDFGKLLQSFFTDRLMRQVQASPNTIASYRDTFRLLIKFAQQRLNKSPSKFEMEDIGIDLINAFLDHIEKTNGNSASSRNVRLAAIRSFYRYVSMNDPIHLYLAQRVLMIPSKKHERKEIEYLTQPEIEALLEAPDCSAWNGRRDRALILIAVQTGFRVSELVGLRCQDVSLGFGSHIRCTGKGRKERCTPLRKEASKLLRIWIDELNCAPYYPLFPSSRGGHLSRDGVEYILRKHITTASRKCHSLKKKRVTPHVLRHSAAMEMYQKGVDRAAIALWLGHESVETTQMYLHASLEMKEKTLEKMADLHVPPGRYKPDEHLLAFLQSI